MWTKKFAANAKKDYDARKRFPNSLSAIFRTVFTKWLSELEGKPEEETTAEKFVEQSDFGKFYLEAAKRFPATGNVGGLDHPKNPEGIVADALASSLRKVARGEKNLDYYLLRAFSDYLEVSDSTILIFGMMTSIDRRVDNFENRTKAMTEFLTALKNVIEVMEAHTATKNGEREIFSKADGVDSNGQERWIANAEILHEVVRAFNKDDLTEYKAANEKR